MIDHRLQTFIISFECMPSSPTFRAIEAWPQADLQCELFCSELVHKDLQYYGSIQLIAQQMYM
jgi:hypothetical protein